MNLYLSSYRIGNKPDELKKLIGANKKAAIVSNALDFSNDIERLKEGFSQEQSDLKLLELEAEALDLRDYFGKQALLAKKIREYGLIWVRGGNTFILRRAMKYSGLDKILQDEKGKDNFVYGGYSAGVCAITPTLEGLETVDDPKIIPNGYQDEVIWEGIGLVDYCFAPHYKSDHPESASVNNLVDFYIEHKILFKAAHDSEVIIDKF